MNIGDVLNTMQQFIKIQQQILEFEKRFDFVPRKMLAFEKKMLSFSSLYDNEALVRLRRVKQELNIINERNAKLTMFAAQYKDLQKIKQTFYGLQFSTTITKNNQTETHITQAFRQETTISQAEHTRILSEKDYLILTQQTIIIQLQTKNKELLTENESLKYQIQYTSQGFQTNLSIQNSKNAKKKEHTELKNLILEIANTNSNILTIKTRSKKALAIEKIIKRNTKEYNNVIQSQISKVLILCNYINETLKKQV